jgi:hypothetical protein
VIGVIAVGITIFILCSKKRKKEAVLKRNVTVDIEQQSSEHNSEQGQFEHDFNNNVEPPKPVLMTQLVEDVSPMMQQYQLQLKLLLQQKEERLQKQSSSSFLEVPSVNPNRASTSSTSSSSLSLPAPPPYHP